MLAIDSGADPGSRPSAEAVADVRAALEIIPMAAVAHTAQFRIVAANAQCAELLRVAPERIQGRRVGDFIPLSDRTPAENVANGLLERSSVDPAPWSSLRRLLLEDGSSVTCWMHVGVAAIAGYPLFIACMDLVNPVLTDAHRWRQRADFDELTGLLRRGPLMDNVRQWLADGTTVALAFLDLDGLKAVNDSHGHAAGDHVLSVIARRLEQYAPSGCLVSRLSGDEFVLTMPVPTQDVPRAEQTAVRLRQVAERCADEPIAWDDHLLSLSLSAGDATSRPGELAPALLARADAAMYREKDRHRLAAGPAPAGTGLTGT